MPCGSIPAYLRTSKRCCHPSLTRTYQALSTLAPRRLARELDARQRRCGRSCSLLTSVGETDCGTIDSCMSARLRSRSAVVCVSVACSCAVLCCAVLCCAVLCCAVLCCAVLCCAVLFETSPLGSNPRSTKNPGKRCQKPPEKDTGYLIRL